MALKTLVSSVVRSANSCIETSAKAALDLVMPSSSEKPATDVTDSTPGRPSKISSTSRCAAMVRLTEAASGRRVSTMKEP